MNEIKVGSCIYILDNLYRIICVTSKNVFLIKLMVDRLELSFYERIVFNSMLFANSTFEEATAHKYIDFDRLPAKKLKQFETALSIVREVERSFGPSYINLLTKKKTGYFKMLSLKYDVSVKTIWKYVRMYLQSGFDIYSLVDKRYFHGQARDYLYRVKTGRRRADGKAYGVIFDSSVKEKADKIIKIFKINREMTIKRAYQIFIDTYYAEYDSEMDCMVWLPPEVRPTFNQFTYYLRKKMSKQDLDEKRSSKIEVMNDKRILPGSSRTEALRPGWVAECDAVEVDLSLVSENDPEQTVGRPIMYVMIDVLTSCIIAASVSFENNSIIGLTNLFINLCEDKEKLCKKYDICINRDEWPSNVIPHEIRCDHGSDFMSNRFKEICRLLKINLNYETPGMGSKKGIVEQSFHQFHTSIRPSLEKYGLITKRHDSKHHRNAMLTISDFIKMVLHYVIYHNNHMMGTYNFNKEMLTSFDFSPTPSGVWKYYADRKGTTFQINDTNRINYIYNLLFADDAKLSRRGIEYKGLFYINQDENLLKRMYFAGTNKIDFPIRYDPRTTSKLYYEDGSRIMELNLNEEILNNADFKDMTWNEYAEYEKKRREMIRKAAEYNMEQNAYLNSDYNNIIRDSSTNVLPSQSNLSLNRKIEKYNYNKSHPIDLFGTNEPKSVNFSDEEESVLVKEEKPVKETDDATQIDMFDSDKLIEFFVKYQ